MNKENGNLTGPARTLFDAFNVFAAAPGGVQKLRELILQLAVQGKLVPQVPNDEPASVLLEKIKAEKERLIKKGKIKKQKVLPPVEPGEVPFSLPDGWCWERLGHTATFINGDRSKNYPNRTAFVDAGIAFINAGHLNAGTVSFSEMNYIPRFIFDKLKSGKTQKGDILFCLRGSLGKSGRVDFDSNAAIASSLVIVRPLLGSMNRLFMTYFNSPLNKVMIGRHDNGSAQPNLSANGLRLFLFPIPPLPEQKRIVAKVDQLMALCDELETKYNTQQAQRQKLNAATLDTLLAAQDQAEFDAAWQRVCDSFSLLYDTAESVTKLRQAILQLAVMGKLVPQDPNDEPASVLLEKIKAEKERLVKEGKIKKQKALPPVEPGEVPFELPGGWVWVWLGRICYLITDGKHGDCQNDRNSGYFFLSAKNIQNGQLTYEGARQIAFSEFIEVHKRTNLEPGDLCIVNTGATVGKLAIVEDDPRTTRTTFQKSVAIVKLVKPFVNAFHMKYFLESQKENLLKKSGGSAVNNLLLSQMRGILFPLPPLKEQQRIAQKILQLMGLCDELEAKLTKSRERAEKLAESVVANFQGTPPEPASTTPAPAPAPVEEQPLRIKDQKKPQEPTPPEVTEITFLTMDLEAQTETIFEALWGKGPLTAEELLRTVAENLRDRGLAEFKRLRKDGALGTAIVKATKQALKYGYLDKPSRGKLRAVILDAGDYSAEDWQMVATRALEGRSINDVGDAIHLAADWARKNCGLIFRVLRRDGVIWHRLALAMEDLTSRAEHDSAKTSKVG